MEAKVDNFSFIIQKPLFCHAEQPALSLTKGRRSVVTLNNLP
jgi:hypothetical protein